MRIVPDSAAPPAQPQPAHDGRIPRRDTESAQRPARPVPGGAGGEGKDPNDYDDGAWM